MGRKVVSCMCAYAPTMKKYRGMEVKLHLIIKFMGVMLIKLNSSVSFWLPAGTV
jgi:hypothetical protein